MFSTLTELLLKRVKQCIRLFQSSTNENYQSDDIVRKKLSNLRRNHLLLNLSALSYQLLANSEDFSPHNLQVASIPVTNRQGSIQQDCGLLL